MHASGLHVPTHHRSVWQSNISNIVPESGDMHDQSDQSHMCSWRRSTGAGRLGICFGLAQPGSWPRACSRHRSYHVRRDWKHAILFLGRARIPHWRCQHCHRRRGMIRMILFFGAICCFRGSRWRGCPRVACPTVAPLPAQQDMHSASLVHLGSLGGAQLCLTCAKCKVGTHQQMCRASITVTPLRVAETHLSCWTPFSSGSSLCAREGPGSGQEPVSG